ncbi:MAG: GNAT family N-acetyltransferase [Ruminococcus sp.]|nr:GNAT family N-acetyltransferase [Ruminococcus sp.]
MIPTIETERLILRPLTVDDAEAVFQWTGDERVTKYMNYSTYSSVEQVREWLETVSRVWGFVRKSDGLLMGSGDISPDKFGDDFWGFGYCFRFDCWNKGYCTEATKAMIKYAFESCGARKFMAQHAVQNPASGRVMEKCGLTFSEYGSYKKIDGSCEFKSKVYRAVFEKLPY